MYFTGNFDEHEYNNLAPVLVLDILRYNIWQLKLLKSNLSYYTLESETTSMIEQIIGSRYKIKSQLINSSYLQVDGREEPAAVNNERP
jgi:hypothetical protein